LQTIEPTWTVPAGAMTRMPVIVLSVKPVVSSAWVMTRVIS